MFNSMSTVNEKPKPTVAPLQFTNPYGQFDGQSSCQITLYIDLADKDLLRACRCGAQGTFSTTGCLLFKQLCEELRQRGITDNSDRADFERFLSAFRIVPADEYELLVAGSVGGLRDRPIGRAAGVSARSNVARAIPRKGRRMATGQNESTNVESEDKPQKGQNADSGGQQTPGGNG